MEINGQRVANARQRGEAGPGVQEPGVSWAAASEQSRVLRAGWVHEGGKNKEAKIALECGAPSQREQRDKRVAGAAAGPQGRAAGSRAVYSWAQYRAAKTTERNRWWVFKSAPPMLGWGRGSYVWVRCAVALAKT